jgi:hypothetical protein
MCYLTNSDENGKQHCVGSVQHCLDSGYIPGKIEEAKDHPEFGSVVLGEMREFEKNECFEWVEEEEARGYTILRMLWLFSRKSSEQAKSRCVLLGIGRKRESITPRRLLTLQNLRV